MHKQHFRPFPQRTFGGYKNNTIMEDKKITASESLKVIELMIRDSRISYRKRDAFPFLLWSCLIIAASLLSYVVIETGYGEYAEWPWIILMIGGGILTFIYIVFKNRSDSKNMNFAQKCASTLWLSFFISMFLLYLMAYYIRPFNFPALIYMITGLCTFTSGSIYRFKPFYAGGIVFWSASLAFALFNLGHWGLLLNIPVMFFGYMIPGIMLIRKAKNYV